MIDTATDRATTAGPTLRASGPTALAFRPVRLRPRASLGWVVGPYLLLIAGILAYNAIITQHERASALVVNVAGRQHAFAERYAKDVLLKVEGFEAAPEEDADVLQQTAAAI